MQPEYDKHDPQLPVPFGNSKAVGSASDRRHFVASTGALAVAGPLGLQAALASPSAPDLIRAENALAGTRDWMLTKTAAESGDTALSWMWPIDHQGAMSLSGPSLRSRGVQANHLKKMCIPVCP